MMPVLHDYDTGNANNPGSAWVGAGVSTRGLVGIKAVGDEGGVDANGSEGSSSKSLRSGLAKQEFITLVDEGNTEVGDDDDDDDDWLLMTMTMTIGCW